MEQITIQANALAGMLFITFLMGVVFTLAITAWLDKRFGGKKT
jgi:hypothetical protein